MSICEKSLNNLFISKVRVKALSYFFLNPDRPIHLRGAVREFGEEVNAVRRELSRMELSKLIFSEEKGNRKYYSINQEHPFYPDLLSLFHKSFGIGGEILKEAKKIGEINYAFLTPAFTKGTYYGVQIIDLVIIGDVDISVLGEIIRSQEQKIGKEVHYMVLKPHEFETRKRRKDQFVMDLLIQDIIMLVGSREDLIK